MTVVAVLVHFTEMVVWVSAAAAGGEVMELTVEGDFPQAAAVVVVALQVQAESVSVADPLAAWMAIYPL